MSETRKEFQWKIEKRIRTYVTILAETEEEARKRFDAGNWDGELDVDAEVTATHFDGEVLS